MSQQPDVKIAPWIDPWVEFENTCQSCRFHVVKHYNSQIGRCRRHAPTMQGYPPVFTHQDWCGDYKVKRSLFRLEPGPAEIDDDSPEAVIK